MKQVLPRLGNDQTVDFYYLDKVFMMGKEGTIETKRQFGVEVMGKKNIETDVAMIQFIEQLFELYSLPYAIEIGHQGFVNQLIKVLDLNESTANQFKQLLIDKKMHGVKTLLPNLQPGYDRLIEAMIKNTLHLKGIETLIKDNNLNQSLLDELKTLNVIEGAVKQDNVWFDLSIVNAFDYYNGPVYKAYITGYKEAVLSGGRYDYLTLELGKKSNALGFSLELDVYINEVINRENA
jgi:ATP phosphoribosyltransferase regulatory subunit